jgi:hypothetical protein
MTIKAINEDDDEYICDCCKKAVVVALRSEKYTERIHTVFGHGNGVNVSFEGGYALHLDICLECIENGAKLPPLAELQTWARRLFR